MGSFCHALPWYTLILFSEVWWNPSWYCLTLSQVAKQIYGSQLVLQIFSLIPRNLRGQTTRAVSGLSGVWSFLVFSKFFKGQKSMNAYCFSPWQVLTSALPGAHAGSLGWRFPAHSTGTSRKPCCYIALRGFQLQFILGKHLQGAAKMPHSLLV